MPKLHRIAAQGRRRPAGADARRRRRAGLSDQAGARDHPVPAGRHQRHRRPPDRHAAQRPAGQAVHRRQPRRRRRRRRHRAGGERAEGRLHAADRLAGEHRQSLALQAHLRADQSRSRRSRSLASSPNVLVGQSGRCRSSRSSEFIALAKKQPGKLQYASGGVGSFMHLGGELFKLVGRRRSPARAVPRRRPGHDRRDRRPHQRDRSPRCPRPRRSAVRQAPGARRRRREAASRCSRTSRPSPKPDCPATRSPTGSASSRRPARRPAIVDKLHKEICGDPWTRPRCRSSSRTRAPEAVRMSPAEFGDFMEKEMAKWGRVVKEGGIKAQ